MRVGNIIDDKWKVIEINERGGQGQVFKVKNVEENDVIYALKYLNKQNDSERRLRMHNEVRNISKLSNVHLMKIVDYNTEFYDDKTVKLYYITDYIEGGTLEQYIKTEEVSINEALAFFMDFLKVIQYCHTNGIIHRDIKPDNILLRQGKLEDFVLIDFGLSFNNQEGEDLTITNQQLGNRFCQLPELMSGSREQKRLVESDLTQCCAVFVYVLTGIIPNSIVDGEGKKPHRREKVNKIIKQKIKDNVVYQNIMIILDRAFEVIADERFCSAEDILRELTQLNEKRVNTYGASCIIKNVEDPKKEG